MSEVKLTTVLQAALQYRTEGRSVFPIIDKKPKVLWKDLQSRLATEEELKAWFGQNPSLQIAMVMGRVSGGIWAMDADGLAAVDWMKHNAPATTVYVRTKRGLHAYYRTPSGVEIRCGANAIPDLKKSTGHQIDIKGEGGYTVVPPSPFRGGEYRWEINGQGWAGLTVWQPPNARTLSPHSGTGFDLSGVRGFNDLNPVDDGERNSRLASIVGKFIAEGMSLEAILLWATGWNMQNNPPLEPEVLRTTVESIAKTHMRNHGSLPSKIIEVDEILPMVPRPGAGDPQGLPPGRVMNPGGLLGQIMDYIEESTVASFSLFSLCAALVVVGTLAGQKVMTETGLRTNLYVFALAPSGTGKNAPVTAVRELLVAAGCSDKFLGPNHLASAAALVSEMNGDKRSLILLLDEIGDLIGSVKNKHNVVKSELIQVLKEMHSSSGGSYSKSYADSKNNIVIHRPHLSFYATGVPTRFWGNLTHGDVTDGFLPRSLVVSVDLEIKKKKKSALITPAPGLLQSVRDLARIEYAYRGEVTRIPQAKMVPKSPEADRWFDQWDDELVATQNKLRNAEDGRGEIYNRAAEQVHKLALIHAVSQCGGIPERVELDSLQFALDMVDWYMPKMVEHISKNVSDSPFDELQNRVLRLVDRKGYCTNGEVYKLLRRSANKKQAEEIIQMLEVSGELENVTLKEDNETKRGRPANYWRRTRKETNQ